MKSIEELRLTAKEANEKARLQNEKVLERSIRENIEYLEEAIQEAAAIGKYATMSDNLCDPRYRRGSYYSQGGMEKLLRNALIKHFTALGFSCVDDNSNYLTISWEKVENEQNSDEH